MARKEQGNLIWLTVFVAMTGSLAIAAPTEVGSGENSAELYIEWADGYVAEFIVSFSPPSISGLGLFDIVEAQTTLSTVRQDYGFGVFIDGISYNGHSNSGYGGGEDWWHYWIKETDADWLSPAYGAADRVVTDGDSDGWVYGSVNEPDPSKIYYVDKNAGNDENDGLNVETAFATIQKGIDSAKDRDTVLVYEGVYTEEIDFWGKAITVAGADDAAVLEASAPDWDAVSFYEGEGPDSVLKNLVIRGGYAGIYIRHSSPTIRNVTIVNNLYGIEASGDSEPNISNCIFQGNTGADVIGFPVRYSCTALECEGEGNICAEPLFADPDNDDYRLLSERGRYMPAIDMWVLDEVTSPCIDAGDPNSNYSNERIPNGGRINMGAYGGTSYASMSPKQYLTGDINQDGTVNMADFAMLAANWLKSE